MGTTANAQAVVSAHGPGTTFVLATGVHRGFQVTVKQGDSFVGQPGAVLDGQGVVGYAFRAFASDNGPQADGVLIRGAGPARELVLRNYDDDHNQQHGAVQPVRDTPSGPRSAANWTLAWLDVYGNYARGLTVATGMLVQGCSIHDNGRLGIGGVGHDVELTQDDIFHNNTRNVQGNYENGGAKFSNTDHLVVEDSFIHNNDGPGIWTDRDAINSVFQDNTIVDNSGAGILNEISHDTTVRYDVLAGNGGQRAGHAFGAGFVDSTSDNVQVYGNLVEHNANAITGVEGNRGRGPYGVRVLGNVVVRDNTVVDSGAVGIAETNGDTAVFGRGIKFQDNHFVGGSFVWRGEVMGFDQWDRAVGGVGNSYAPMPG